MGQKYELQGTVRFSQTGLSELLEAWLVQTVG